MSLNKKARLTQVSTKYKELRRLGACHHAGEVLTVPLLERGFLLASHE